MIRRLQNAYDYPVHGVDNAVIDDATLAAAFADLNTYGNLNLVFSGDIHVTGEHVLTKPGRWTFRPGARFKIHDGASIKWGNDPDSAITGGAVLPAHSTPFVTDISSPNLSLAAGDFIALIADNPVTGLHSIHSTAGGDQFPLSVHRVVESLGSNNYQLQEHFVDALTTNPRIAKLDMIRGVVIDGLRYTYEGGAAPTQNWLFLNQLAHARIINPQGLFPVPGGIWFDYCYDVTVEHPWIDSKFSPMTSVAMFEYGYNMIVGTCTRWRMICGDIGMCRHGVTTTASIAVGENRWGTSLDCSVDGTTFSCAAGNNGSNLPVIMLDSHAEGYGWKYSNIKARFDRVFGGIAVNVRSRSAVIDGLDADGGSVPSNNGCNGIGAYGPNLEVRNSTIKNCWSGIYGGGGSNINSDNLKASRNTFESMNGPGIYMVKGSNNRISHSEFIDVSNNAATTGRPRACVALLADSSPKILQNNMPRYNNPYAIHLVAGPDAATNIRGNDLTGYDESTTFAFDPTTTPGPGLATTWKRYDRNIVDDPSSTSRDGGEDDVGTITGTYTLDFDADSYDSKVMTLGVSAVALTIGITRIKPAGFDMTVIQDGTGGRLIDFQNVVFIGDDPQPAPAIGAKSLYRFWLHSGTIFGVRIA